MMYKRYDRKSINIKNRIDNLIFVSRANKMENKIEIAAVKRLSDEASDRKPPTPSHRG